MLKETDSAGTDGPHASGPHAPGPVTEADGSTAAHAGPRSPVAVLGATGCVGRHVCAAFAARGHEVVAVARREAHVPGARRFLALDLAAGTGGELARTLAAAGAGTVVNATLGWGRTEDEMAHSNVRPVRRLLDALRRMPAPPRLVHLGTIHEYGPLPYGSAVDERAEPHPASLYARSKVTASRMVLDALHAGEVPGTVLRLTNTVGPHPALESFFGALAVRLRRAGPDETLEITIADARRDYVDVRDAADAVVRAADGTGTEPLLNIGRGEAVPIQTLVRALVAASGRAPSAVREHASGVRSRSGGSDWIQVDTARARRTLGWRPRYTVDQSMRAMWETVA